MSPDTRVLINVEGDDSHVAYGGKWTAVDNADGLGRAWPSTADPFSWVFFSFNGTLVSVFGSSSGNVTFCLDDNTPFTYTSSNAQDSVSALYTSPLLQYGEHSVNVSLVEKGATFVLNFFQITTITAINTTASSSTVAAPTTPHDHRAPALAMAQSTPSGLVMPDSLHENPQKISKGVLAGIVIGLVVLLAVAVALVVLLCKMRWHDKHRTPSIERGADILGTEVKTDICSKLVELRMKRKATAPVTQNSQKTHTTTTTAIFSSVISVQPLSPLSESSLGTPRGYRAL
ncbi:hypothetical protein BXZ70DRAFT_563045 [Cristinia sonorae]|uniref:Uncharacterized protein n=1 Tax=Cristinia sonorae TaxID=1940300 RepID=A0A8K0UFP8_9AGAR|nr:hypothetical protein BXZ70DRAFT_563045 [Cristinia sonorae]